MDKIIDIKSYFPRFKGITNLTPGHLYEDEKGVEIIFVGYGSMNDYMKEDNGSYNYNRWGCNDSFLYIKKNKLMSYVHKEIIINSNKFKNIVNQLMFSTKGELDIFNLSSKPRKFVKDLGEYFPQEINPEILGYFESDKYEHDFAKGSNEHVNVNGSNCRFGNYWIFDFK